MSRRREPVAELGAEDYRIVRHTHDLDLAARLMREAILAEHGCPRFGTPDGCDMERAYTSRCPHPIALGTPVQVYVRIQGALPGSYAEYEGWRYTYHEVDGPARGAFKAVVFR